MNKKWIICIIVTIIVGFILGAAIAIFSEQNRNNTEGTEIISEKELASITNEVNNNIENNVNSIETVAVDDVVSPNAIIVKKTYYESCDHLIRKVEEVPEDLINKTEEDVKKFYSDWNLEEFTPTQINLYKTASGNCGEHYFVQEHNGIIGIYTVDEYGVKSLKEDTEISTQYLPDEDIQNLKAGVEIIGYTKLMEFLEDYE